MKLISRCIIFCCLFLVSFKGTDQPQELNYKMHALFIYHFTKYINWPPDSKETFTIGILGKSPILEELQNIIKEKTINNKKVELKELKENSENITQCDIIFIAEHESKSIKKVTELTAKNSILVVTEKPGMIQKGADINFLIQNEKLRFEISKTNLTARSLKVSNELLKLATTVQ